MQFQSAIITVNRITLAAVLVDADQAYPAPAALIVAEAQRYFPTLPIILLSPRICGFSRSFATFQITDLLPHINTDLIDWTTAALPTKHSEVPF